MTTPAIPSCFMAFSAIPILILKFSIFYYTSYYSALQMYCALRKDQYLVHNLCTLVICFYGLFLG